MHTPFDPDPSARALADAWHGQGRITATRLTLTDDDQAYAVQDALMARLGQVAGWKVGASSNTVEPNAAPLPASVMKHTGAALGLASQAMRLIELEVAVRLRSDLLPGERWLSPAEVMDAVQDVLPVIEIVDSRLVEGRAAPATARLADLQSHGALVLGPRSQMDPRALDLTGLRTRLWFDDALVTDVTGGHTAPDIWRLIAWLARHAQARGRALRAGDIVTTGSCTPPVIASEGARVTGEITGLGRLDLTL